MVVNSSDQAITMESLGISGSLFLELVNITVQRSLSLQTKPLEQFKLSCLRLNQGIVTMFFAAN